MLPPQKMSPLGSHEYIMEIFLQEMFTKKKPLKNSDSSLRRAFLYGPPSHQIFLFKAGPPCPFVFYFVGPRSILSPKPCTFVLFLHLLPATALSFPRWFLSSSSLLALIFYLFLGSVSFLPICPLAIHAPHGLYLDLSHLWLSSTCSG